MEHTHDCGPGCAGGDTQPQAKSCAPIGDEAAALPATLITADGGQGDTHRPACTAVRCAVIDKPVTCTGRNPLSVNLKASKLNTVCLTEFVCSSSGRLAETAFLETNKG